MRFERTLPSIRMRCSPELFSRSLRCIGLLHLSARCCPLAIAAVLNHRMRLFYSTSGTDARIKARFQPFEQSSSRTPGLCASFKTFSHVRVQNYHRAQAVCLLVGSATFGRIFGLSPSRAHLALRLAAARASRAFE